MDDTASETSKAHSSFSLGETAADDEFDALKRPSSLMSVEDIQRELKGAQSRNHRISGNTLVRGDTERALRELLETPHGEMLGGYIDGGAANTEFLQRQESVGDILRDTGGKRQARGSGRRCTNSGGVSDTFTAALQKHAKVRARRSLKHVNKVQANLAKSGAILPPAAGASPKRAAGSFVGRSVSGMRPRSEEAQGFCGQITQCIFRWGGCNDDVEDGWLVIPPNTMWKHVWDAALLLLVLYNAVMLPWQITFNEGARIPIFDTLVDIIFVVDVVFGFHSGFIDPAGNIIDDLPTIRRHYLSTYFVFDFVGAIPFDMIASAASKDGSGGSFAYIGMLKNVRILRIGRVISHVESKRANGASWFRIFYLIFAFSLLGHWIGCTWYQVSINLPEDVLGGRWIDMDAVEAVMNNGTTADRYLASLYFAMVTISTVGYGDISPQNPIERIIGIFVIVIGAGMFATIFGTVSTLIQQHDMRFVRYNRKVGEINDFCDCNGLPKAVRKRLLQYMDAVWEMRKGLNLKDVLDTVPDFVHAELLMHLYADLLRSVDIFRVCDRRFLEAMVLRFRPQAFLQGDYLIRQGDVGNEMFFLMRGVCVIVVRKKAKQPVEPEDTDQDERPQQQNGHAPSSSRVGTWSSSLKSKMSQKLSRHKNKGKKKRQPRMTRLSIDTTHDPTIPSNDSFRAGGSASSDDSSIKDSIESATQRGRSSVFTVATAGSNKRRRPSRKKRDKVEFMMSSMSKWKRRLRKWMAFANPLTLKTPSQEGANYVDSYVIKTIRDDPYMVEIARRGAGNFVGEQSLLTSHRRMASVVALSLVQTYYLLKADFDELVEDSPDVRNYLQIVAERRVRDAYKRTHSEKSMVGRDALNEVSSVHDGLSSAESLAAARQRSQRGGTKRRSFTTSSSASSQLSAALAAAGAHSGNVPGPTTDKVLAAPTGGGGRTNAGSPGSINLVEYVETGEVRSRKGTDRKAEAASAAVSSPMKATRSKPHLRHAISTNSTLALETALADIEKIESHENPDALPPLAGAGNDKPVESATANAVEHAHHIKVVGKRMTTVEKRITMLEAAASERHADLTQMILKMSQKLGGSARSRSNWEGDDTNFGYKHGAHGGSDERKEGQHRQEVQLGDGSDNGPPLRDGEDGGNAEQAAQGDDDGNAETN